MDKSLAEKIKQILEKNRRTTQAFQYTIPSPDVYPYQWLWDSCFHAIFLSYSSPEDAKQELRSLISAQFENGMIPHIIYWEKQKKFGNDRVIIDWGKDKTSTITQPPMLAYAVLQIYKHDGDKSFLEEIYPSLKKFYDYILSERDTRQNHLAGIINPDESGEDNSPRFDIPLGNLEPQHSLDENFKKRTQLVQKNMACDFDAPFCMRNFFWVKDVPFNVILLENLHALSDISTILSDTNSEKYYFEKRSLIARAMRKFMLEDGIYWSTYGTTYEKIKVKTWAIFAPLWAGLYTHTEADNLINNHLLNSDEFWTEYLVPTVAKNEPSYQPIDGFWRGPIWIATNWFIYKGLARYGYNDLAQQINQSSIALIKKSGFREYFNPETGEGYGAHDFTWGALILDMN